MAPWTLTDIAAALRTGWAADTCSPDDMLRSPWSPDNPAWGHCDITALVIHDIFGGDLVLGDVHLVGRPVGHHWWNRLPNGVEIDLTREQFRHGQTISRPRAVPRPPGPPRRRREAYRLLRARVADCIGPLPVAA
ncbi:hypothetical protein [Streptomyces sp. MP131-18]|uniref:YunG family protein n=1 Tax=Streptomyces sp. MP131-18 TaxID=1857892 RepID=UPI00097CB362|nr:hypothetical protein [Streptomyces sp. MP131-18]ONK12305.1 hypothetical protein STBA_30460 [Streptomyces sp. MP131-18]